LATVCPPNRGERSTPLDKTDTLLTVITNKSTENSVGGKSAQNTVQLAPSVRYKEIYTHKILDL